MAGKKVYLQMIALPLKISPLIDLGIRPRLPPPSTRNMANFYQ